jgi:hypothetical protein
MIACTEDLASDRFKFENRKLDRQQQGRGHDRVTGLDGQTIGRSSAS